MKSRDVDCATMFGSDPNPVGIVPGTMRFSRSTDRFEDWDGSNWRPRVISVSGGGTGSSDPATVRNNLGIGTLGLQNANAVAITGGAIQNTGLWNVTQLDIACTIYPMADAAYSLGHPTLRWHHVYIRNGLVIPVGANKYVP